ncbi:MAG: hypothetical protein ABSA18_09950 [Dehalococcoidia bacterium]
MAARGEAMTYTCPYCKWRLSEPDPAAYSDTEQGQDALAADYAYFELEKEQHDCNGLLIRSLPAPHEEYTPL